MNSIPPNLEEGMRWLQASAVNDYAPAMYLIGVLYYEGVGEVQVDISRAWSQFCASADREWGPSMYILGRTYLFGLSATRDELRSLTDEEVERFPLSGNGDRLFVSPNTSEALHWLEKAVQSGHEESIALLSHLKTLQNDSS